MLDLTYTAPKPKVISGAKGDWELVIGMEIHAQVSSNAKLFSGPLPKLGQSPIPTWPLWTPRCPACCL